MIKLLESLNFSDINFATWELNQKISWLASASYREILTLHKYRPCFILSQENFANFISRNPKRTSRTFRDSPTSMTSPCSSSSGRCFLGGRAARPSSGRLPDLRLGRVSNSAAAAPGKCFFQILFPIGNLRQKTTGTLISTVLSLKRCAVPVDFVAVRWIS